MTLSYFCDELAQTKTSKKIFLMQMEKLIPWDKWVETIKPCYYKGERGNKPYDLEQMLRIYILQNLYDLSDMRIMTEVIDSRAFSEFCGIDSSNQVPDGDTIGRFRNILVKNGIQEKLFSQVVEILKEKGLIAKPTHDHIIRFTPPLVIDRDQMMEAIGIIKDTFAQF